VVSPRILRVIKQVHVILAGGGVGGLTAALALADRAIAVTVLEQAPVLAEVGAGLQLSPNATRLLIGLGLEESLKRAGFAPEAARVCDHATGALLLHTPLGALGEARWGAPYLQIHRADLHGLLLDAAKQRPQIAIRLNAGLVAVSQSDHGVMASTAGGETVAGDVVIGCDGIHSTVRTILWGAQKPRFTRQVAWRGLVPQDRLPTGLITPFAQVWTGGGRHFVHYPVRGGALVNFIGVVEQARWADDSWTAQGDPSALRAAFAGWPAPVEGLIAQTEAPWIYAIHDRPPLARWSKGRISLLGDAAHPAPPFLAQGAGMAIEDAEALARFLRTNANAEAALLAYERERRGRTARVQAWSRRNARLFHLPSLAARAVFGAASALDQAAGAEPAARLDWIYGYQPPI
jgi:salicylate hydroxylase